jgi:periplasmic divalent cation tolerance protein
MVEIVFCTVPSAEVADTLARGLVERHLAACVNVVPSVRSFYRWEGALQVDDELLLKIKTTSTRRAALVAWLVENHPYDVPEILAVRVEGGSQEYLEFVEAETSEPTE